MDSGHEEVRVNVEDVECDRISSLPDDLIHKILSFIGIKEAVKTSCLSFRWRYIWSSMATLNFSSKDFSTVSKFSKFVTGVLTNRNNQIEVYSVELSFLGKVNQRFVKRILNYAFSHNVQRPNITCLSEKNTEFPLSLFTSQSLKHLTLNRCPYNYPITTLLTWKFPALTTLDLRCVTLYDDSMTDKEFGLLSNCANLKNLTLNRCRPKGLNGFSICHPGLISLTLEDACKGVNVVTPQLMNLSIIDRCQRIRVVSAPNLSSLCYKDDCGFCDNDDDDILQLPTGLLHLEKVDICINSVFDDKPYTRKIVCLLQQLRSVRFLTLNLELVKLLSLYVELISHQPSPFVNLKSLKIYPTDVTRPKVIMSTEVNDFLLDGSPGATLTMVSHEETQAVINVTSARNLMIKLQGLLDQWKNNYETNTGHMKQDKAPMEIHIATVHAQAEVEDHVKRLNSKDYGERMTHIMSCWKNLNEELEKRYHNTFHTVSLLQKIEQVLAKVPASHQAKLQARFSELLEEAEIIMYDVMDHLMIQCDKKPSRSNVFFNKLATSSHLFS